MIGAGWAARFLVHGVDVRVFDPDPNAPRRFRDVLANAGRAMAQLFPEGVPQVGKAEFAGSLEDALHGASLVIESVPERVDLKRDVHRSIERWAPSDALVSSSTSGIRPSILQDGLGNPGRLLVAHPFNPVYLLPLVELCGGAQTSAHSMDIAAAVFREVGMQPLLVRNEIDGFLADRLMEAMWREALWLVHDGVATTEEVDDAIRFGAGLRWALMGPFQTFSLAGGEGGIRSMLEQFGPCLKWPWTRLTDVPDLTGEYVDRIAFQCESQAQDLEPHEVECIRDDGLVRILQGLEAIGWAAGQTLSEHRRRLCDVHGGGTGAPGGRS